MIAVTIEDKHTDDCSNGETEILTVATKVRELLMVALMRLLPLMVATIDRDSDGCKRDAGILTVAAKERQEY